MVNITTQAVEWNFFYGAVPSGGTGTGFIVNPDGTIVTNYHVVRGAEQIVVTRIDGNSDSAQLVGYDPLTDLAAIARAVQALSADRPDPELPEHLRPVGAAAYSANCVQCHGENGDGRGSAADSLPMAPTNFARQRASLPQALRAVREGIPGSPMAPWTTRLSDAEVVAVVHYVRSLYPAPASKGQAQ